MRADGIVDFFPVPEFAVELVHRERARSDLVELFGVGTMGAFHRAAEFGRTWRENEQMETALLAGLFELGGKLGPPSICTSRMGKGTRCCKVSRNSVAAWAVARGWG
jgi:hypothetical protein